MPNFAYTVHVTYTNKSGKADTEFIVLANDEADALRLLIDADVIGSEMSTFTVRLAPYTSIVYRSPTDDKSINRVPGRPMRTGPLHG